MDKLRLFIEQNREAFDREELPAGHAERFGRKLPVRRRRFSLPVRLVAGAAAAVLLFALLLPFRRSDGLPEDASFDGFVAEPPAAPACRIAAEVDALCRYRTWQMRELVDRIRAAEVRDSEAKRQVLEESGRILAAGKQFEKTVVPQLPRTDEALDAMNRFYLTNLESLGFMLRLLEESGRSGSSFEADYSF